MPAYHLKLHLAEEVLLAREHRGFLKLRRGHASSLLGTWLETDHDQFVKMANLRVNPLQSASPGHSAFWYRLESVEL